MQIDPRVRARDFIKSLDIGKTKFYSMIRKGEIKKPVKLSERDVFWYASYVKEKVEEHKQKSDTIAHI